MKVILFLFYPLSWLYQFLFWVKQSTIKPIVIPDVLVISVGNITVGGTGKTPFVQYLVRYFQKTNKDYAITILSRGYKAKKSDEGAILPDGKSPHLYGDEPSQHKDLFPSVQVIIGKNRWKSFQTHNQIQSPKHIVILDDGFQHKQICRDFDIVLLDANAPFANGLTIPLGFLREPITHLKRAHSIVFTKLTEKNRNVIKLAKDILNKKQINVPESVSFFQSNLVEMNFDLLQKNVIEKQVYLSKEKPNGGYFLFTGVGNPRNVLETAESILGENKIQYRFFPDHYEFEESVLFSLIQNRLKDSIFVTTEKDWVKVRTQSGFLETLKKQNIRLFVLKIEVVLAEEQKFGSMLAGLVSTYEVKNGLASKTG